MPIKPPVAVIDGNDVCVFRSVTEAEKFVEPEDAETGELELFDADGRVLEAVADRPRWFVGRRTTRIKPREPEQFDVLTLRSRLATYAAAVGITPSDNLHELLDQLVQVH
jgi:hypothetical protein